MLLARDLQQLTPGPWDLLARAGQGPPGPRDLLASTGQGPTTGPHDLLSSAGQGPPGPRDRDLIATSLLDTFAEEAGWRVDGL